MRTTLAVLFTVITALFAPVFNTAAHSQSLPLVGSPNGVSVGLFLPSSGDAKNAGGSSQLYVDFQYGFPVSVPFTPTRTVVNLAGEFGTNSGHHSYIVPLTIGEYIGADGKSPFAARNFYAGVGAGIYFESIGSFSSSGQLGGYATVGYNIGLGFFVQAKYQIVKSADGPIISAGARF
jgi:hypothetical protein